MVQKVNVIHDSGFVKKSVCDSKINETKDKIPSITGSALATTFNDAKNKIPDISDLVKKQIIPSDYNKFMNETLDVKIKNKKLVNESDISEFIQKFDLNEKLKKKMATKRELKAQQGKIVKLQTCGLSLFIGPSYFITDRAQNYLIF